jgi:hypothetical protein
MTIRAPDEDQNRESDPPNFVYVIIILIPRKEYDDGICVTTH